MVIPREEIGDGREKVWLLHVHWLTGHYMLTGRLRGQAFPQLFFFFFAFCLSFIGCLFLFMDFKKVVVCWSVGPWVLFYLVSQSNEPTIGEGEACEIKNWREE